MTDLPDLTAAYTARRILRAKPGGATHKRLLADASPMVLRLVEILPPLLEAHCIATAERLAVEAYRAEMQDAFNTVVAHMEAQGGTVQAASPEAGEMLRRYRDER